MRLQIDPNLQEKLKVGLLKRKAYRTCSMKESVLLMLGKSGVMVKNMFVNEMEIQIEH